MITSQTLTKLIPALLKAQKEMEVVIKDSDNPYYKSKYADINSFLESMVPVLNKNGFLVLQPVWSDEKGTYVETNLLHESGEYYGSGPLKLELDKLDMQKLGSAITYARRYSLQSLLGARAQDDDAEGTMTRTKAPAKTHTTATQFPDALTHTGNPQTVVGNGTTQEVPKKGGFASFKKAAEAKTNGNGSGGLF